VTKIIRSRPVTSFLVLTFAISYIAGIPFNFVTSGMLAPGGLWATYLPRAVTVLGPALAAIVVAWAGGGTLSLRRLLRSLSVPRRYLPWLAVIVAAGTLLALGAFTLAGVPLSDLAAILRGASLPLGAHLVIQIASAGIGEELGWRGWLLPALARRRSFVAAAALTGVAWTLWHLPVFFSGATLALSFLGLLSALTVVQAWLWKQTAESVGVVAVACISECTLRSVRVARARPARRRCPRHSRFRLPGGALPLPSARSLRWRLACDGSGLGGASIKWDRRSCWSGTADRDICTRGSLTWKLPSLA
jgi:membrane protease YdiL (CAAX protease family)